MTCPICQKPAKPAYRPFCSRRCADIDLGRWLGGQYSLPVADGDDIPDTVGSKAETDGSGPH